MTLPPTTKEIKMNAKKAKALRRAARNIVKMNMDEVNPEMSIGEELVQVRGNDGSVLNTLTGVRGVVQYMKNPNRFLQRGRKILIPEGINESINSANQSSPTLDTVLAPSEASTQEN